MGDDWDDESPVVVPDQSNGRVFGSRGRGFQPPSENANGSRPGGGGYRGQRNDSGRGRFGRNNDEESNGFGKNGLNNEDDDGGWSGGRKNDSGGFRGRGRRDDDEDGGGGFKGRGRRDDNEGGGFRGRGRRDQDNEEDGGGGGFKGRGRREDNDEDGEDKGEEKKREIYIPPEPTNDENEMFGGGISSGINFDKYDSIPVKVSGDDLPKSFTSFQEANLRKLLADNITKSGYTRPTPIQKHALAIISAGRDLMACAQTGSGKTAAFLVPIINTLMGEHCELVNDGSCVQPQAVIVSPTRELTKQIFLEARKFAHQSILKICHVYGGTATYNELRILMNGCHILVATPGRLMGYVSSGKISFASVRFAVLDEADRMLDMGFAEVMRTFLNHETMTPKTDRQTLMFSATFPEAIQRLAGDFLNNYVFVAVGEVGGACTDVEQKFYSVSKFKKREKLVELLNEHGSEMTLVFVEQKRSADIVATFLCEKNYPTTSMHGDRLQRERETALADFKNGRMNILIATNVGARGLDIKNVRHVINYDLPKEIEDYVHRIGRTGRVGNKGLASSFYDPDFDMNLAPSLVKILRQAGQVVPDFLENGGGGGGDGGFGKSGFGGRDFRKFGGGSNNQAEQPQEPVEEEEW